MYFILWVVIWYYDYLFYCSNHFNPGHWEFLQGSCVCTTSLHFFVVSHKVPGFAAGLVQLTVRYPLRVLHRLWANEATDHIFCLISVMGQIMLKTYSLIDWCIGSTGSLKEILTTWRLEVVMVVLGVNKTRQDPSKLQLYCLLQLMFLLPESLHSEKLEFKSPRISHSYWPVAPFAWNTEGCQDFMMINLTFVTCSCQQQRKVGSFLVWVPPEADLVIGIQVQILSMGGYLSGEWRSETGTGGQPLLCYRLSSTSSLCTVEVQSCWRTLKTV